MKGKKGKNFSKKKKKKKKRRKKNFACPHKNFKKNTHIGLGRVHNGRIFGTGLVESLGGRPC